jgi:tetratricopeptide (TPR) repeat protein
MSDPGFDLVGLIPRWVVATKEIKVPTPPAQEDLDRDVRILRVQLRDADPGSINLELGDKELAIISRLCFDLERSADVGSGLKFLEASRAYRLVSNLTWPDDQFGERNEVLADLALLAWRASRYSCSKAIVQGWEREYLRALAMPSTSRDHLVSLLQKDDERCALPQADLSNPPICFALWGLLWETRDSEPSKLASKAVELYRSIELAPGLPGAVEEHRLLLGLIALAAAVGERLAGRWSEGAEWLDTAEAMFRETVDPTAHLLKVSLNRLCLQYDSGRYQTVIAGIRPLIASFDSLGMTAEAGRSRIAEANSLKAAGQTTEAFRKFQALRDWLQNRDEGGLLGSAMMNLGELEAKNGRIALAMAHYRGALRLFQEHNSLWMIADLKARVGETLLNVGRTDLGIEAYRESMGDYARLGMKTWVAYIRVRLAEVLLLAGCYREAELEILAALPTIEQQGMMMEGLAAVALLRESVRCCNTDREALRQVRKHLEGARR